MSDARDLVSRWLWLELPARWVRVKARFGRPSNLDLLEETLLRLVSLAARSAEELSSRLGGVSLEVVTSTLTGLALQNLVHEEPGAVPRWSAAREDEYFASERVTGWVACTAHDAAVLPDFVLGERAVLVSELEQDGGHRSIGMEEAPPAPLPEDLNEAVRAAVRRGLEPLGRDVSPDEVIASAVVDLDGQGRGQPVDCARACWALVELVPSLTGSVTAIFHEPSIARRLKVIRPVSRSLGPWVKQHLRTSWLRIETEMDQLRRAGSLVLELAGIGSMEELDERVRRHRVEWERRLGVSGFFEVGDEALRDAIRDQQRWLILAAQRPQFTSQAYDSLGHAFERFAQLLAAQTRPALVRLRERWRVEEGLKKELSARWRTRSEVVAGLALLGTGALGPSERHLTDAVADLKRTLSKVEVEQGSGASLTLFTAGLLLGTEEERQEHAARVVRALRREPQLFSLLDALREIRDAAAHVREKPMSIGRGDELLARCMAALHR